MGVEIENTYCIQCSLTYNFKKISYLILVRFTDCCPFLEEVRSNTSRDFDGIFIIMWGEIST